MWEIYALFPRSKTFEMDEIERIKSVKPGFAVILDFPLDGRRDLLFHNTHPETYTYIRKHFRQLSKHAYNPAYKIFINPYMLK
jgi:hypothetical protein